MNERLEAILKIVAAAAVLTGEKRAGLLIEVFRVGAQEYAEITGRDVDWSSLKHIPEIT